MTDETGERIEVSEQTVVDLSDFKNINGEMVFSVDGRTERTNEAFLEFVRAWEEKVGRVSDLREQGYPLVRALLGCRDNGRMHELVSDFLKQYPGVCWMSGFSLGVEGDREKVEMRSFLHLGRDGLVGTVPLGYIKSGYSGTRGNPAIMVIPLTAIVSGSDARILDIGSGSGYDIKISVGSDLEKFSKWFNENALVVKVDEDVDELEKVFEEKLITRN